MINKNYTDCKSEEKSNGGEVDSHRRLNFGTSKFSNMNVLEALFLKSKTDVSDVNIRCKKEGDRVFSFIKLRIISVKEMGDILNHYYYKYHLTSILTSFLGKIKKKVNHVRSEKVHHLLDVALIKLGIKDYYWTHKNFYDGEILKKKNIYFKSKDESVLLEEMVMGDDERDYTDILPFILFYFIPASYIILKEKRKQIGHNFLFSASLYALFMSLLSSFKEEMIIEYSIIISSVLATIFAATTLVYKYVKYSTEILNLYTILLVITFLFTNTNNIFNFFLLYELFLLPSIYISMYYSPNRRSYSSTNFFLLWTQLGSSLFLLFALNMRFLFGYLNFFQIKTDQVDLDYLYQFFFLIGILIKVPTFPFYFWLLKTHVEAMTSFSILLSGFLVKIAILCLYKFLFLLKSLVVSIAICLSLVGSASASILFIHQIDFKKFVAYSTIQEMGLISTLLLITQSSNLRSIAVFLVMHTVISSLFFFLSDSLFKRFWTRSYLNMQGLIYLAPKLTAILVTSTLFFRGLPFTAKFYIELNSINILSHAMYYMAMYAVIYIFFSGNLTFTFYIKRIAAFTFVKIKEIFDLTKFEFSFYKLHVFLLVSSNWLI